MSWCSFGPMLDTGHINWICKILPFDDEIFICSVEFATTKSNVPIQTQLNSAGLHSIGFKRNTVMPLYLYLS
jgi:hypothetical protein